MLTSLNRLKSARNHSLLRGMIAAFLALVCFATPLFTISPSAAPEYQEGDIVTFGRYEQDNITSNGAEDIEWIVLKVCSDRLLLLSRYALDSERYHYCEEDVDWETCSLRKWLNGSFFNDAFSFSEQRCILSDFSDAVFVLSQKEAEYYLPQPQDRICYPTAYCAGQNVYVNPTTGGSWWLLRTPGEDGSKFVMSVNSDGTMDYDGGHVESDRGVVRPAIWVRNSVFADSWYCPSCGRYNVSNFCSKDGTSKFYDLEPNAKGSSLDRTSAEELEKSGRTAEAAMALYALGDKERSFELWDEVAVRNTISSGRSHMVGLKSDGTVVAVGFQYQGACDVETWRDIVAVSAGGAHTVGLKANGTVMAVGCNDDGQCDVSDWKDIVAVSAGEDHTVGLKADGTVVAAEKNLCGECDVNDWVDIVQISCGETNTIGLKSDGTVVTAGLTLYEKQDVRDWLDIMTVSAGATHTVGLKTDGTVVADGLSFSCPSLCDVEEWRNIKAISAGFDHTLGLKADGTVLAVGSNKDGTCDVAGWKNIVAINAGTHYSVGLKADGTVVAVGTNDFGQCDVADWKNIRLPSNR